MNNRKHGTWPLSWKEYAKNHISDFPPTILFVAPLELKLEEFVFELSKDALCKNSRGFFSSCNSCQSCKWCSNQHHPDLKVLKPTDSKNNVVNSSSEKGEIKIDHVRELLDFFNLTSHQNGVRIAVIGPIEKLNYPAANALLKTMEEPSKKMHFFLFSHSLQTIPTTVLSRCRKVFLPYQRNLLYKNLLDENLTLKWLLPLLRMQDKIDPCLWAKKAGKTPPQDTLKILVMWMNDVFRINVGLKSVCFPSEKHSLTSISNNLNNLTNWIEASIKIQDMIRYSNHPLNLTLFYESIFYEYQDGFN